MTTAEYIKAVEAQYNQNTYDSIPRDVPEELAVAYPKATVEEAVDPEYDTWPGYVTVVLDEMYEIEIPLGDVKLAARELATAYAESVHP